MLTKSLKMLFFGFIATFVLPTGVAAEKPANTNNAQTYADGPAIWKISDADTTIYLFGTVHILTKETEWRTDDFDAVWQNAETIYFEADTSPEAQAGMQQIVMSRAMNEKGTTLSSFFDEEQLAFISEEVARIGLPLSNLEPFRPWFAGVTLSVMQIVAAGGDPAAGVEMILGAEAREAGKALRFFETAEEQIGFFADMSDDVGAQMLLDALQQSKDNPEFFTDLVTAWKDGQLDQLEELLNTAMRASDPVIAATILYERNAKWADSLATVLEEEPGVFLVAVGAGHLIGEKSVQDYLAQKGISAARL